MLSTMKNGLKQRRGGESLPKEPFAPINGRNSHDVGKLGLILAEVFRHVFELLSRRGTN